MSPLIGKSRLWPVLIVTTLVIFVTFTLLAARVASHDPHFAIEPDYYGKAIAWDSTLAEQRRAAALGWRLTPALGPVSAGRGAPLVLTLSDSLGAPITGASIAVEARQVAHADDVVRLTLTQGADARYTAALPLARSGLVELRIVATRASDRFSTSIRLDASATSMARVVDARPGDASPARLRAGARREHGVAPVTPVTPGAPVTPVAPVAPVTPVAPVAPVAPVTPRAE